jgi:UPF0755 protein
MNPWLRRLLSVGAVIVIFLGVFWYFNHLLAPVRTSGRPFRVDIPIGSSAAQIAERLRAAGAIRSPLAFNIMIRLYGGAEDMKAGEYLIPPDHGVIEIIDQLIAGQAEQQWVVVPEGKTVSQVAALLEGRRLVKSWEFVRTASKKPKMLGLHVPVSRRSVEGYLMPDTYKFPRQISERKLIKEMLENWNEKVYRPNRGLFEKSDLPLDKIVILASLVEREARVPQDRELIAAVIRNRLKKKMRLQVDATVLYSLGRHKKKVLFKDLKHKHPYNTYANPGLPPGPICSPGLASIQAALQPAKVDYLYYVARPDGSHIFSHTYEEHRAAIEQVRSMTASAAGSGS